MVFKVIGTLVGVGLGYALYSSLRDSSDDLARAYEEYTEVKKRNQKIIIDVLARAQNSNDISTLSKCRSESIQIADSLYKYIQNMQAEADKFSKIINEAIIGCKKLQKEIKAINYELNNLFAEKEEIKLKIKILEKTKQKGKLKLLGNVNNKITPKLSQQKDLKDSIKNLDEKLRKAKKQHHDICGRLKQDRADLKKQNLKTHEIKNRITVVKSEKRLIC